MGPQALSGRARATQGPRRHLADDEGTCACHANEVGQREHLESTKHGARFAHVAVVSATRQPLAVRRRAPCCLRGARTIPDPLFSFFSTAHRKSSGGDSDWSCRAVQCWPVFTFFDKSHKNRNRITV